MQYKNSTTINPWWIKLRIKWWHKYACVKSFKNILEYVFLQQQSETYECCKHVWNTFVDMRWIYDHSFHYSHFTFLSNDTACSLLLTMLPAHRENATNVVLLWGMSRGNPRGFIIVWVLILSNYMSSFNYWCFTLETNIRTGHFCNKLFNSISSCLFN